MGQDEAKALAERIVSSEVDPLLDEIARLRQENDDLRRKVECAEADNARLVELLTEAIVELIGVELYWHNQDGVGSFEISEEAANLVREARLRGITIPPLYEGFDLDEHMPRAALEQKQ